MLGAGLIFVFISFVFLVLGIGWVITSRRRSVKRRLGEFSKLFDEQRQVEAILAQNEDRIEIGNKHEQGKNYISKYISGLQTELAKADLLLRPQEYLMMVLVFSTLLGIVLFALTKQFMMIILGIVLGSILSKIFLNIKKTNRISKLNHQLVDTITLISNGLKAGYSFLQAAEMVSRDMRPPISDEFKRMIRQTNLGMTVEEALKALGERSESQDMDLVITAILIQRQIGGNLAEVLDNITDTIRERIKLKNDIKAKTAQGRLSGIILILLPFGLALLLYIMSPDFMGALFLNPEGWAILGIAALLQVVGIFFIVKIISIDV